MKGWAAWRLLGVFPANSWLTPRRLGRERIPQPCQPPEAGTAGRDLGSARHGSAQHGPDPAGQPRPRGSGGMGTHQGPSPCLTPTSLPLCAQRNDWWCWGSHPAPAPSPARGGRRPDGMLPRGWSQGRVMARERAVPTTRGTGPSELSHAQREL